MRKTSFRLVSFLLGAIAMFLASHVSLIVQNVSAQQPEYNPNKGMMVIGDVQEMRAAVPVLPQLPAKPVKDSTVSQNGVLVRLDGLNCEGCTFDGVDLAYGGGQFKCACKISNVRNLVLDGVAMNTVKGLAAFGYTVVRITPKAPAIDLERPHLSLASVKDTVTWDVTR